MWEPAIVEAIKKDINAILSAFYGQTNLSFNFFKVLWVQQRTSYLHFGAHTNIDRDAFYQLVYDLVLRLLHNPPVSLSDTAADTGSALLPSTSSGNGIDGPDIRLAGPSIVWNMGVVYFLYTFCCTQVRESKSIVHVSPEIFANLRIAVEQMSWLGKIGEDAAKVFELMLEKKLFLFGLTTGPATQWGSHRYEECALGMRSSFRAAVRVHQQLEAQVRNNSNAPFVAEIIRKYAASFNDDVEQEPLAQGAVAAGDDTESEGEHEKQEGKEEEEQPVQRPTVTEVDEQEAEPAQEPPKKRTKGEEKATKSKTLSAKNSVEAVLRLLPAHRRGMRDSTVSLSSSIADQSVNPVQGQDVPGSQQEEEEESSSESSSDSEEGEQYLSQRQREAERLKAHIKKLNEEGI